MRIPRQISLELGAPGTAPESLLPVVLTMDDNDSPRDVIDALALTSFVAGHQPFATTKSLTDVREDATLLPPGVEVTRESHASHERARLALGDGWTLRVVHFPRTKQATVTVTAVSAALAADILAKSITGVTEPPPPVSTIACTERSPTVIVVTGLDPRRVIGNRIGCAADEPAAGRTLSPMSARRGAQLIEMLRQSTM